MANLKPELTLICFALAIVAGWAGGNAAAASQRLVVPFQLSDRDHMVVPIIINNHHQTTGVIDTAATFAMVDSRSALQGGIAPPGADAARVNVLGVNGAQEFPIVRLESIRAGNVNLGAVDAAFNRNLDIPGAAINVLPVSAFPGDVLEFDFNAMLISAYNGRPDRPNTENFETVSYKIEHGLIFVDVRINGRKGRALIDTGSNVSYVNLPFAELAKMGTNVDKTVLVKGATGGDVSIRVATARKIQIGGFNYDDADIFVLNTELFKRLGLEGEPIMVLGLDLLSAFKIQFDRRRNQMILILPPTRKDSVGLDQRARGSRLKS